MEKLKVLSLFAGIGGFDLGLERTGGFETVAFCEIDKKAQQVLRNHWPEVPIYDDVTSLTAERLAADGIAPDCIVGGFPCQDISTAGLGAGIEGERSGLWSEYFRLIGELRPLYVIVENVSALLGRGLDRVLGDLASLGYNAWWDCIPASAVGAPHRRDRVWIVAYPDNAGLQRRERLGQAGAEGQSGGHAPERRGDVAYPSSIRLPRQGEPVESEHSAAIGAGQATEPVDGGLAGFWAVEPSVGRVAHGVPGRVDRLKQLGNAVVPEIPELIGNALIQLRQEAA